jgi:hypothetical protein
MVTETAGEVPLTDVERRLVDHVVRGEPLDLAGGEPVDEAGMRSWDRDSSRTIQAAVLRDILRGRLAPDPDPHGLRLRGARIAGQLDLENLTTNVGVYLYDCLLGEGLIARDATLPFLLLPGCRLEHRSQPPLAAEGLTATDLVLDRAVITANCKDGAVLLYGAHLGRLRGDEATIRNDSGPALAADGLQVDHSVLLRSGFEAVGAGDAGAVRLVGAHLGTLDCSKATIRNGSGPALAAFGLQVDQNVYLHRGFEAVGGRAQWDERQAGTLLSMFQDVDEAMINDMIADGILDERHVFLSSGDVTLDLRQVRIGGVLFFSPSLENTADPHALLDVDGLTYAGLPVGPTTYSWLRLLRERTPMYAAQPYQQFAAAYRAAGHDGKVRRILMAQRQAQIDRKVVTSRAERAWARLTGLTLGYGYQPWKALIALVIVAAISVILALILGANGGLARTNPQPPAATQCSAVERVAVGLVLQPHLSFASLIVCPPSTGLVAASPS